MRDEYTPENREKISGQVNNQKFQYRKDSTDWGIIFVVLITTIFFGAIFFGGRYLEGYREVRTPNDRSEINQLIEGEKTLEQELKSYEDNNDFNDN